MCRWVAKKGGKSDGVAVGDVGGGLRGVVATRDFAVGDTVFSVPKAECVLSEGRADASPDGAPPSPARCSASARRLPSIASRIFKKQYRTLKIWLKFSSK